MERPYFNGDSFKPSSSSLSPQLKKQQPQQFLFNPQQQKLYPQKHYVVNNINPYSENEIDFHKKIRAISSKNSISSLQTYTLTSSMDNNNLNTNPNDVKFERVQVTWLELAFPITILTITICGIVLIAVILFRWLQKYLLSIKSESVKEYQNGFNSISTHINSGSTSTKTTGAQLTVNLIRNKIIIDCVDSVVDSSNKSKRKNKKIIKIKQKMDNEDEKSSSLISPPHLKFPPPPPTPPSPPQPPTPPPPPQLSPKFPTPPTQSPTVIIKSQHSSPNLVPLSLLVPDILPLTTTNSEWTANETTTPPICVQPILYKNYQDFHQSSPPPIASIIKQHNQQCRSPKLHDKNENKENVSNNNSPKLQTQSHFTFSPKIKLQNINTQISSSPLTSVGYKLGNYFRFPDVDILSPPCVVSLNTDQKTEVDNIETDTSQIASPIDFENLKLFNTDEPLTKQKLNPADNLSASHITQSLSSRRARLKSISLDSESARLVEENLGIPVEEIIENRNNLRQLKNKSNLTININQKDDSLNILEDYTKDSEPTPKTPTLTQTRKKAISLDSDNTEACSHQQQHYYHQNKFQNYHQYQHHQFKQNYNKTRLNLNISDGCDDNDDDDDDDSQCYNDKKLPVLKISSISVPTTPKRQNLQINNVTSYQHNQLPITTAASTSLIVLSPSQHFANSSKKLLKQQNKITYNFTNKLGSFDEATTGNDTSTVSTLTTPYLKATQFVSSLSLESSSSSSFIQQQQQQQNSSNLQILKTSTLSLSNNNLKTLPEVMTLSDFSTTANFNLNNNLNYSQRNANKQEQQQHRNSILQRRGSNHSLTLNLDGSVCNLTKSLSTSNYSLGSHYNLSDSTFNLNNIQQSSSAVTANSAKQQMLSNKSSSMFTMGINNKTTILTKNNLATAASIGVGTSSMTSGALPNVPVASSSASCGSKKNLLQRRGSNTSLTLNIQNSSCSLNRFNSHSSLNISSNNRGKGLLERRNSNASLTLNIHNRGLSISNSNLRGSACSLSSINTNNIEITENLNDQEVVQEHREKTNIENEDQEHNRSINHNHHQRKYFSSENLSSSNSLLNKKQNIAQTQNYGSIDDLKQQRHTNNCLINHHHTGITDDDDDEDIRGKNDCQCIGNIRNITTKPLSPQSTSEDFKIYLANIQYLQNATNILTEANLKQLNVIFQISYQTDINPIKKFIDENNKLLNISSNKFNNDDANKLTDNSEKSLHIDPTNKKLSDEQKIVLRNLHQEFWDLPTNYQEKPMVFGSQSKNRYKTILPNEHSRVILNVENGNLQEPYINANYIKGPDYATNSYIATQGPMQNTIYEFWLMVLQSHLKTKTSNNTTLNLIDNKQKIIMLTDLIENNRQKCANYFPKNLNDFLLFTLNSLNFNTLINYENINNSDEKIDINLICSKFYKSFTKLKFKFNFFMIKNEEIIEKSGYTMRKLLVMYYDYNLYNKINNDGIDSVDRNDRQINDDNKFYVYHYWFPDWPDHRSPEDIDVLLDMSLDLLDGKFETDFLLSASSTSLSSSTTAVALSNIITSSSSAQPSTIENPKIQLNNSPLPIIHCSAGIGRTGCLAAILNGLRQIRLSITNFQQNDQWDFNLKNLNVDVLGIVCNLRLQRGGMVQNSEQYELIHRALCLYQDRLSKNGTKLI